MEEDTKVATIRIPLSVFSEIERIAVKRKMSQAQVFRMVIGIGTECHKDMERIGVVGVVDLVYFAKEAIKEKAKGKQLPLPI